MAFTVNKTEHSSVSQTASCMFNFILPALIHIINIYIELRDSAAVINLHMQSFPKSDCPATNRRQRAEHLAAEN